MLQCSLKTIVSNAIAGSFRWNYSSVHSNFNNILNLHFLRLLQKKPPVICKQLKQCQKLVDNIYKPNYYRHFWTATLGFSFFGINMKESETEKTNFHKMKVAVQSFFGKEQDEEEVENEIVHMMKLAVLAAQKGDSEKAEQLLHIALKSAQEVGNQQAITYIYDLMANFALEAQDFKKAEKLFVVVLQRFLANGVPDDDNAIVEVSLKLSNIYIKLGDLEKAAQGFHFCIITQDKKLQAQGVDNVDEDTLVLWAMSQDWYARFLLKIKSYEEAKQHFIRAYDVCIKVKGPDDPQTAVLLNDIGSVCSLQEKYDEAISFFNKAIDIGKKSNSEDLSSFYVNLGTVYIQKEFLNEAESYCSQGLKLSTVDENEETVKEALTCLETVKKNLK